jgi:hypothetical protein
LYRAALTKAEHRWYCRKRCDSGTWRNDGFNEEVSTWTGRLVVAIGEGKFHDAVERGVEAGKLQTKNAAAKAKLR